MTIATPKQHTLELLRAMLNDQADFRSGQWEAIEAVAIQKKRALVVQRTGWRNNLPVLFRRFRFLSRLNLPKLSELIDTLFSECKVIRTPVSL